MPEDICVGCKPGDEKIALFDAIYGVMSSAFQIGMQELNILLREQFLHHSMKMLTVSIMILLTDTSRTEIAHPSILFLTSVQILFWTMKIIQGFLRVFEQI